ncbi:MAG: CehA/McbA family metallohydrolase, partial [Solirubrobacterales bacterium]|nr:CehA/McbA family metallohydrolase [Solirubrobacterales bacterium]
MGRLPLLVLLLGVAFAAPASAHDAHNAFRPPAATRAADGNLAACPGAAITPARVITGSFGTAEQGSNVLVPFDVPAGTIAVRVKYCFDQPESPLSALFKHTLDLGIYQARKTPGELFDGEEFRGWGGSSHPDVTLSRQGPSTEAQYRAAPKEHVPGRTTRGFRPGPVPAGEWAAELGVAAVVGQESGDADGRVAWRVEVELSRDPAFARDPWVPARYDATPARKGAGWYAGDLHVHAEHSALGDATMTEVFDYAFRKPADGGAGLDFLTLSDYVAGTSWAEIGRYQPQYPGKLVVRSAEVITYRGHLNAHGTTNFTDYRTGRLLERRADGTLVQRRAPLEPKELFGRIKADGGWTQVNHPTIFPSEVPGFAGQCRGCPWDYTDAQTDWDRVDAYEVHTGPAGFKLADGLGELGPNPFTLTAVDEYDRLRRAGHRIAAVGVSDSHNAGRTNNAVTQSPIGVGTTVVRADELSEDGIRRGVQAGHTYVKLFGPASPDLRLDASAGDATATMGDRLVAPRATFTVKVTGGVATPQPRTLLVLRDGRPVEAVPVSGADFTHTFTGEAEGDYRVQVLRGTAIDALTTPITLTRTAAPAGSTPASAPAKARLRVRVRPRAIAAGRRTTFRVFAFT